MDLIQNNKNTNLQYQKIINDSSKISAHLNNMTYKQHSDNIYHKICLYCCQKLGEKATKLLILNQCVEYLSKNDYKIDFYRLHNQENPDLGPDHLKTLKYFRSMNLFRLIKHGTRHDSVSYYQINTEKYLKYLKNMKDQINNHIIIVHICLFHLTNNKPTYRMERSISSNIRSTQLVPAIYPEAFNLLYQLKHRLS